MKREFVPYEQSLELKKLGFKEETLEEAAERFTNIWFQNTAATRELFIDGAKWQEERIEEDMRKCWDACKRSISEGYVPNFNEWFEQFKKK